MTFTSGECKVREYDRAQLLNINKISGPALLVQSDCTILLPPDWQGVVDAWGNIEASTSSHNNTKAIDEMERLHNFPGK